MTPTVFAEHAAEILLQQMQQDPGLFVVGPGVCQRYRAVAHTKLDEGDADWRFRDAPAGGRSLAGVAIGAALAGGHPVLELLSVDDLLDMVGSFAERLPGGSQWQLPILIKAPCASLCDHQAINRPTAHLVALSQLGWTIVMPADYVSGLELWRASCAARQPVVFLQPLQWSDDAAASEDADSETNGPRAAEAETSADSGPENETGAEPQSLLGRAHVVRTGTDVTVATAGVAVSELTKIADQLQPSGKSVDLIDLRTLWPLDRDTLADSVAVTGRLLVVGPFEDPEELASLVRMALSERCFAELDMPIGSAAWCQQQPDGQLETSEQRRRRLTALIETYTSGNGQQLADASNYNDREEDS